MPPLQCRRIELTGLDGAGKTSIAAAVAAAYGLHRRSVVAFDEAFEVRARRIERAFGPRAVMTARAAAIAIALLEEAATPVSGSVIWDRYLESAQMFWSVAGSFPLSRDVVSSLPANDTVVLLDVPIDVAMGRAKASRFSDASLERQYLSACREYLRRTASHEHWIVVDATQPFEATSAEVAARLGLMAPRHGGRRARS